MNILMTNMTKVIIKLFSSFPFTLQTLEYRFSSYVHDSTYCEDSFFTYAYSLN